MLRFFVHATTRSNFLSLFMSPVTTVPAPPGIEIGEPGACVNNDCCASVLLAFPDWHAVKSRHRTAGSAIERVAMEYFKTYLLCRAVTESRASTIRRATDYFASVTDLQFSTEIRQCVSFGRGCACDGQSNKAFGILSIRESFPVIRQIQ